MVSVLDVRLAAQALHGVHFLAVQEGKELQTKAKSEAAAKNEVIKQQLERQLQFRKQQEDQEKQEEMDYAQLEQVGWAG
jgi:flagellar motility protein MotE (MotC chaperone)